MIENIMQTSFIFSMLFVLLIKFHGDDDPPFLVKLIEVIGMSASLSIGFITSIILIWQN